MDFPKLLAEAVGILGGNGTVSLGEFAKRTLGEFRPAIGIY